jgi:type I restriction enzyme S subunit
MVALAELVDFKGGGTPSKSIESYWGGNIPWASVKDFKSSKLSMTTDFITAEGLKNSASNLIPAGNLIVPTRMALGKVAINTIDIAINQDLRALIVKDEKLVDKRYLLRFLESKAKYLESEGKGATVKGITQEVLKELEIPLPSLAEQKRIAAILDKADSLRRKNQQAIQLADQFLRAVFLDMFGDPVTNPKRWKEMTLSDAVKDGTIITYGIVQAGAEVENGVPYIRTGDFKNGCLVKSGYARTHSDIAAKFERSKVSTGDLVYCIRASIGSVDIVPKFLDGANLTQGTAKISPGNNIKAEFLVEFLRTKGFRDWIDRYSKGATFKEITLERLRAAPVLVPPLHIQEKFIAIRNKTLHAIQTKTNMTEIPLFESLSQKAFAGEL